MGLGPLPNPGRGMSFDNCLKPGFKLWSSDQGSLLVLSSSISNRPPSTSSSIRCGRMPGLEIVLSSRPKALLRTLLDGMRTPFIKEPNSIGSALLSSVRDAAWATADICIPTRGESSESHDSRNGEPIDIFVSLSRFCSSNIALNLEGLPTSVCAPALDDLRGIASPSLSLMLPLMS